MTDLLLFILDSLGKPLEIQCPPVVGMVLPNLPQFPGPFVNLPLFLVIVSSSYIRGPDTVRGLWLWPILKIRA